MTIDHEPVNTWAEPQLFPSGGVAVTLQALFDLDDGTVLFVVESRDVVQGKLLALWSSSPQQLDHHLEKQREAYKEFARMVQLTSSPFP